MADGADATTRRTSVRAAARHGRPGLKAPWRRGGHSAPRRRGLRLFLASWAFLALGATAGTTRYVNVSNPTPAAPFETWATASNTVQAALDVTVAGDEVWVAAGTYEECLFLPSGVALVGGFLGTETALAQRDWEANETILDGAGAGRVITVADAAAEGTCIDGFTITGGYVVGHGGGIYAAGTSMDALTHVRVLNNHITANATSTAAAEVGGGCFLLRAVGELTGNLIEGNTSTRAGGAYSGYATLRIEGNTIIDNTATVMGGGMYITKAQGGCLAGNRIIRNQSNNTGGGIHIAYSPASFLIENNVIGDKVGDETYGNHASNVGGGVAMSTDDRAVWRNNAIRHNTAATSGGGLIVFSSASPALEGNIIEFNQAQNGGGFYLVSGGWPTLTKNTIADNTATASGGGVFITTAPATLTDNTISGNTAGRGGGVYMAMASATLTGNTITSNTASVHGGASTWRRPHRR